MKDALICKFHEQILNSLPKSSVTEMRLRNMHILPRCISRAYTLSMVLMIYGIETIPVLPWPLAYAQVDG